MKTPKPPDVCAPKPDGAVSQPRNNGEAADVAAAALNEQGFLFQHKVLETLREGDSATSPTHRWRVEAVEVPVSVTTERETKIDIVLRHGADSPWRAVLECKRSARDYKRWIFFGEAHTKVGGRSAVYSVETADLAGCWDHQGEPNMMHRVDPRPVSPDCPVFDFYVEAKVNRPNAGQRASATEAIEDAFRQVTLGQVGLAHHLRATHELKFRLIPIVVTTAEVLSAHFDSAKVSLSHGKIAPADLELRPQRWVAVNYHLDDTVAEESGFSTNRFSDVAVHLGCWQVRTVFVVEALHLQEFLTWIADTLTCD